VWLTATSFQPAQENPLDALGEHAPPPPEAVRQLLALSSFLVFSLPQEGQAMSPSSELKTSFSKQLSQASH
jgi:hypothetical protein